MSKFIEGKSGNPKGRPSGIKDKRALFAELLDNRKDDLFNKAIEMALDGNESLLKLFLDRLLPAKPKDDPIDLNLKGTAGERTNQIMSSLADGAISPMQASEVLGCIEKEVEINDVEAFAGRLTKLEEKIKDNQNDVEQY